jgi:transcriptional regulator GlxA family with amidase domain
LTVCTGAFPLAKAGAFDGLEITTFYGAVEGLRAIAPKAKVTHGRRFVALADPDLVSIKAEIERL